MGGPSPPANTTTTTSNILPAWATKYAKEALALGKDTAERPYQAYGGERVANLNAPYQKNVRKLYGAAQQQGFADIGGTREQLNQTATQGKFGLFQAQPDLYKLQRYKQMAPYQGGAYQGQQYQYGNPYEQAAGFTPTQYNQAYKNPGSNPFLQETYNQAAQDLVGQYQIGTAAQTDAAAARAHALGGSAYNELTAKNQYGLGQNLKNLATDIYGQNYQAERGREQALQELGSQQRYGAYSQNEAQRAQYGLQSEAQRAAFQQQDAAQRAQFDLTQEQNAANLYAQQQAELTDWRKSQFANQLNFMDAERARQTQGFMNERNLQLEANRLIPQLGAAQQQLVNPLQAQADMKRAYQQQLLDQSYGQFLEKRDYPLLQMDIRSALLSGALGHGQSTSTSVASGANYGGLSGALSGALGGGLLGYGAGQLAGDYGGYGAAAGGLLGGLAGAFG